MGFTERNATIVIDTPVPEDLEVLQIVALVGLCVVEACSRN